MSSIRNKFIIDLNAVAHNWRLHADQVYPARCSAVVKADAYGLGVREISLRLYEEGCREFFVASLQEAQALKKILLNKNAKIFVLAGVMPGDEHVCIGEGFIPVLVSLEMFRRWQAVVGTSTARSALKVDTGMGRLGLSPAEVQLLVEENALECAGVELVLSHLACADEPEHTLNKKQLERFISVKDSINKRAPGMPFCLANSAGCALGSDYHFDMVRPGIGLYGVCPFGPLKGQLKPAVNISLEVVQVRESASGESVGYGATYTSSESRIIAVAAGGYADGLPRNLSNRGKGFVSGHEVPMVGRVSMDSIMFDVTEVRSLFVQQPFPQIEILGSRQSVNQLAEDGGTVGYELLTSIGKRFGRVYLGRVSSKL